MDNVLQDQLTEPITQQSFLNFCLTCSLSLFPVSEKVLSLLQGHNELVTHYIPDEGIAPFHVSPLYDHMNFICSITSRKGSESAMLSWILAHHIQTLPSFCKGLASSYHPNHHRQVPFSSMPLFLVQLYFILPTDNYKTAN